MPAQATRRSAPCTLRSRAPGRSPHAIAVAGATAGNCVGLIRLRSAGGRGRPFEFQLDLNLMTFDLDLKFSTHAIGHAQAHNVWPEPQFGMAALGERLC